MAQTYIVTGGNTGLGFQCASTLGADCGNVVVIANDGPGICTTSPAVFDSFRAGNVEDGTGMTPL